MALGDGLGWGRTSGSWNGRLEYNGYLDHDKEVDSEFMDWAMGWTS